MDLIWNDPSTTPDIAAGSEKTFWIAVDSKHTGRVHVFLAQYQNRPFSGNEDEDDDCLVDLDGEIINSVGWVDCKVHTEFDNYFEAIDFNDKYVLVGWAEYTPPEFTGVKTQPTARN